MASDGGFVPLRTTLDLRNHVLAILAPGTTLDISAGDALRTALSLLFLGFLFWPIVLAAVAGAWLVFVKAGRPGWACLVPGYNLAQLLLLAKLPRRSWVLLLVPGVNVVLLAVACCRLAHAFRKGPGFAAGLVLLPPLYMTILGMSRARYRRFEVIQGAKRNDVVTEPSRLARTQPSLAPTPGKDSPQQVVDSMRPWSAQPVLRLRRNPPQRGDSMRPWSAQPVLRPTRASPACTAGHPPARTVTRAAPSRASPRLHLV